MSMPKYRPKWLHKWSRKLIIGPQGLSTAAPKMSEPRSTRAEVQSYPTLPLLSRATYPSQKLNCVTIVAGFNDNSSTVSDFAIDMRFLINLIVHKFNQMCLLSPTLVLICFVKMVFTFLSMAIKCSV